MKNTAKKYIDSGLSILPVKKTKQPAVIKWKGVTFKPEDFEKAEGIGIRCGKESGGLECYDFDNHFGDAKKTISNVVKEMGELYTKYKFPIQSTQSGGYHLLLRCSETGGNQKLASRPKLEGGKWRPDAIIETRGEGGYFVAAPTEGYSVIRNDITTIPTITPEERNHIIEICKSLNEWAIPIKEPHYEDKERPGDFYNSQPEAKEELVSLLRTAGWHQVNNYQWRRPGKDKGISATLGKVAPNVFYNFSSNAFPFEPEKAYSPFQVLAILKYNSDFKQCAKELSEKYSLGNVNNYHKPIKEVKEKEKTKAELDKILMDCFVDISIKVEKPPVILEINHSTEFNDWNRLLTLGNFSAIIGKSKSKKTFLTKIFLSILGANKQTPRLRSLLPENKRQILHFDTEQSYYDVWKTANDIHNYYGVLDNVGTFRLREKTPKERLAIIRYAIETFKSNLGVVVIDGIADLVKSINSEDEANKILYDFMRWTEEYNIHIMNVIHQNKSNDYATGWLGSQILKRAELVVKLDKDTENTSQSIIKCEVIRGAKDFPDMILSVDDAGMATILSDVNFKPNYL